jgi:hypothetical protein
LPQRNACGTLSHTGEKRCTTITSQKGEPSRDRNYIQRNRTNIRNQEKAVNRGHHTLGFHLTGEGMSSAHKKIVRTKAK